VTAPVHTLELGAEEARSSDTAGGKAARLADLARAGFPVPPGFVVTTTAFARLLDGQGPAFTPTPEALRNAPVPPDVEAAIRAALTPWGETPMAVRSSAVAEDLPGASFAGQYETVLDVRGAAAVLEAVRACWASAVAPRVLAYRADKGLPGAPRMAVLVQQLVQPVAAGVAFSANPVTGRRDEVVVNAVRGLGERLVSGEATADEWIVGPDERAQAVHAVEHALTTDDAHAVAALARRVERHYAAPQDIEWALAGAQLHLLQARPITALPDAVEWNAPAPGLWLRAFRLGEWLGDPITPLFETWLLERIERRLFARLERVIPAPTPLPYHVTVHGWYYTTTNFMPRSVPQALWLGLRYLLPAAIRRPRQLSILTTSHAHHGMQFFEDEWRSDSAARYERAVAAGWARVEAAPPDELVGLIDALADLAGDQVFYLFAVGGGAWKTEAALAKLYRRHLAPRIGGNHQDLLQGLGEPAAVRDHLVLGLDWQQPTLGELGLRAEEAPDAERRAEAVRRREEAGARARIALAARPRLAARFEALLARAQHFGRVREEQAARLTLAWPLLRRAVHRLGERLVEAGALDAAGDTYFLTQVEVLDALAAPPARRASAAAPADDVLAAPDAKQALAARAADRRALWESQRRLAPPVAVGNASAIQRRILGGFEAALGAAPAGAAAEVRGLPASPGRATGRVRIIRGAAQFGELRAGEVLVAPATNPGWTPLFARAAAVVTDTGSVMAHASLVAREYAIPAVVGTGNATRRLRDGQLVTVDGNAGTVDPHA
jgi:pyruvate,water dikinase